MDPSVTTIFEVPGESVLESVLELPALPVMLTANWSRKMARFGTLNASALSQLVRRQKVQKKKARVN
jgi:hypothetical protein